MADEKVTDTANVVEVYSNRVVECSSDGAVFSIVLGKYRQSVGRIGKVGQLGEPETVINSRICISEQAAVELHNLLATVIKANAERRAGRSVGRETAN